MARTVVTIDGDIKMDADLERYEMVEDPTLTLMNLVKQGKGKPPQPWMGGVFSALLDAVSHRRPTHIDVRTQPMGWTLHVRQTL